MKENELPLCIKNILDKNGYKFYKWANKSDNSQLLSKTEHKNSCRLVRYSTEHVITCFDYIRKQNYVNQFKNITYNSDKKHGLHFMFIGDSRIRQQFFYFLKVSNNYM
jgi:hypothetical protein